MTAGRTKIAERLKTYEKGWQEQNHDSSEQPMGLNEYALQQRNPKIESLNATAMKQMIDSVN